MITDPLLQQLLHGRTRFVNDEPVHEPPFTAGRWAANEVIKLRQQLDSMHKNYAFLMQERNELVEKLNEHLSRNNAPSEPSGEDKRESSDATGN